MKSNSVIVLAISLTFMSSFVTSAPQTSPAEVSPGKYTPYSYEYKVEDAEQKLYHDKAESQDESGKVRKFSDEFDGSGEEIFKVSQFVTRKL